MANEEIGNLVARVSMDQTSFQDGISKLNRQMKLIQSEFQAASAKLGNFGKSTDGLKLQAESLTKQLEVQRARIQTLESAYQKSLETKGKDATATQNLEIKLNKARAEMAKMEAALKKVTTQLEKESSSLERMRKRLEEVSQEANKSFGPALEKMASAAKKIGAAIGAAFGAAGSAGVVLNAQLEQSTIAFTTMLGSAEKAQAFLEEMRDFAARTPFEFNELQGAAKRMLAFGFAAEEVIPMMTTVGNAAAGLGGSQEMIDRITLALGQMQAKSKVSAQEMLQLAEAGVPAWQMLADKMGMTTAEVMKLSEKGLIPAKFAIDTLVEGMNTKFGGMMEQMSTTMSGLWSTMKDNAAIVLTEITGPLFEKLKNKLNELAQAIERWRNDGTLQLWSERVQKAFSAIYTVAEIVGKAIIVIAGKIAEHWDAITIVLSGVVSGFIAFKAGIMIITAVAKAIEKWRAVTLAMAKAQGALNLVLSANPIGLIAIAIGVVTAAVVALHKAWTNNWGGIRDKTKAVLSLLSAYIDKFVANVAISFTFLKSKVFDIINSILDKVAPLAKLLPDSISGAFDKLRDSLKDKSEDVKDQLDSLQRISAEASERIADSMGKVKEAFSSKEDMSVGGFRFKAGEAGLSGEKDVLSDLEEALAKVDNQAGFTADSLDALNDTAKKAAKAAEETRAAWEIATDILSAKLQTVRAQQETAIITTEIAGEKTKALADKIIYLRRQHELQSQIVAVVNEAYQESVAAKGEDAEESVKLAARLAQEQQAQAELEKQIHEITQALKDQAQELRDLAAEVEKVEKKYKDDLAEAYDEYYQKRKEVNRKLAEDEKNLTLQFEQELAKRAQSLANFVGLFEEVTQRQVSGEQLLKNLQDQVATFEEWQENIAKLAARGVDEGLIEELREMGPKAAPEIAALNTLTDEQLTQYVALWRQKNEAARNEAVIQMEQQRAEMQKKLAEIRRDATAQLNEYRKEWEQKTAQIRQNAEEEMQKIEEKMKQVAVSSTAYGQAVVENFTEGIESRFERLRATLEKMTKMVDDYMPHSPARRGALSKLNQYGPALVQGIADGIKRSMNKLESVVAQMAALTPGAMRPALAASYNTSNNNYGGNTIYINITGAGGNPRQIADDLMRELRKRGVRF